MKQIISTPNAPQAIGTYSQAVKADNTVYLSGQIALVPDTMEMVQGDFADRVIQVFKNLTAVCEAAGGTLQDIVKFNVFLTSMDDFPVVNEVMAKFVDKPYPARAAVAVKELPKGTDIEIEGVMVLGTGS